MDQPRSWRCVFPRNELRNSGLIQASIIALAAGSHLRHVAATGHASWWPYALFGYGFLAALMPWIAVGGGFVDGEFHPAFSLVLGVIFALPQWVAARWLAPTPYHLISIGCRAMVALWGVHLLVSIGWLVGRARRREKRDN